MVYVNCITIDRFVRDHFRGDGIDAHELKFVSENDLSIGDPARPYYVRGVRYGDKLCQRPYGMLCIKGCYSLYGMQVPACIWFESNGIKSYLTYTKTGSNVADFLKVHFDKASTIPANRVVNTVLMDFKKTCQMVAGFISGILLSSVQHNKLNLSFSVNVARSMVIFSISITDGDSTNTISMSLMCLEGGVVAIDSPDVVTYSELQRMLHLKFDALTVVSSSEMPATDYHRTCKISSTIASNIVNSAPLSPLLQVAFSCSDKYMQIELECSNNLHPSSVVYLVYRGGGWVDAANHAEPFSTSDVDQMLHDKFDTFVVSNTITDSHLWNTLSRIATILQHHLEV